MKLLDVFLQVVRLEESALAELTKELTFLSTDKLLVLFQILEISVSSLTPETVVDCAFWTVYRAVLVPWTNVNVFMVMFVEDIIIVWNEKEEWAEDRSLRNPEVLIWFYGCKIILYGALLNVAFLALDLMSSNSKRYKRNHTHKPLLFREAFRFQRRYVRDWKLSETSKIVLWFGSRPT